jgi:phospholipid transport system substrate-binding protein
MKRLINTLAAIALAGSFSIAIAQSTPDATVKSTVDDVLEVLKKTKDKRALRKAAEEKVLPKFDFKEMTRLAVGPGWKEASPEQQQALEREFRSVLVNTYTSALATSEGSNATVEVRPVPAAQAGQGDVTVKTVIKQSGKQPVAVDYRMSNSTGSWKVNDVVVENLSLVTTYRGTFSETVKNSGIDGLIKTLQDKNRNLGA